MFQLRSLPNNNMNLSIIIPLFNEQESLSELHEWIVRVMKANQFTYEIIFIDDGSKDESWVMIESIAKKDKNVKAFKFQRNYGKSPALHIGFEAAVGDVVITMDADLQDSPDEIPGLYQMIVQEGFDLVSGWKKKRYDNAFTKNFPSKLYNFINTKIINLSSNNYEDKNKYIYLHMFDLYMKQKKIHGFRCLIKSVC